MTARLAYGLTGIGRRLAHASLTLQAAVEAGPGGGAGIEGLAGAVDQFARGVETAGQVIAGSLRSLRPPGDMPPLRELQIAVYDQLSRPRTTAGADRRNGQDPGGASQPMVVSHARAAGRTQAAGPGTGRTASPDATVSPGPAPADTDAVLLGATDEFTDALDTAADLLRRRLNGS